MFGVDFSELALVFVVALLVLGPTRLPGLVRKVGTWVGKARGMARQFREQLESEVNLEELNRMTEARAKEARSAPPTTYPPPPPEFGGEPIDTTAPVTPSPNVTSPNVTSPHVSSPEAMAQSEVAEPEYIVPPPGDASHNDLSEPTEHPQDSPNGRAG